MAEEHIEDALSPPSGPPPDPQRIGRYVVIGRLGSGGMGVVYSAYDESLDRKVAIKLLHSRSGKARAWRVRLKREAQALAQLSHPNVVQVYDVGEWNGQDFIALEFIRGETLRAWMSAAPRRWTEIVDIFVQAGRGLAAAHAAGLIHRDFKPDNVLIGADGRARVADFGLALLDPAERESAADSQPSQSNPNRLRVTEAGALIGTPAYMAPEQFLRQDGDVRLDQFAFCATFYEALYGYRPFAGHSLDELSRSVLFGELRDPPLRTPVPGWIATLLRRGLSPEPEKRFPSMDLLLAELTRERGRLRRRLAAGAAFVATAAAAIVLARGQPGTCQGAAEHLVGVWDDARRAAVESAILATGLEYAPDTWRRVHGELDAYASAWIDMHTAACTAHQRGEQSSVALDLRMTCLDGRRTELAAVVQVLGDADVQTVNNAVQATRSLPAIAGCGDTAALLDEQRRLGRPVDPATEARVNELRVKLAQLEALVNAGQIVRAVEFSGDLPAEARAIGYLPTLAEAELLRARALQESGAIRDAAGMLRRAYLTALRANHEMIAARARVADVYVQAADLRDYAAAERSYETADALLSRIAPDGPLAAELLNNLGTARLRVGRITEAEALHRASVDMYRRATARGPTEMAAAVNNLALDLHEMERFADAEVQLHEAVALIEGSVGRAHPWAAVFRANLALVQFDADRLDEARAALDQSFAQMLTTIGRERSDSAELFAVHGLLHLDDDPVGALDELLHAYELGERLGLPAQRCLSRFALAQGLWRRDPRDHARAVELARAAADDAAASGRSLRRAKILAWLAGHAAEDMAPEPSAPGPRGDPRADPVARPPARAPRDHLEPVP